MMPLYPRTTLNVDPAIVAESRNVTQCEKKVEDPTSVAGNLDESIFTCMDLSKKFRNFFSWENQGACPQVTRAAIDHDHSTAAITQCNFEIDSHNTPERQRQFEEDERLIAILEEIF
jgi:hypothetical protein